MSPNFLMMMKLKNRGLMKYGAWKRAFLSLLCFVLTLPAFGDTESLVLKLGAAQKSPESQVIVTLIPESEQEALLEDLSQHLLNDPKSAALVATAGSKDALSGSNTLKTLEESAQVVMVESTSLSQMPAVTPKSKKLKDKIHLSRVLEKVNENRAGVLVSVVPAGNYGALVYFMSADSVMATASFGLVFGLNAFQSIFTNQWLQFASLGDKGMRTVASLMGKMVGKTVNEKALEFSGNIGRVGWTTAMNVSVASITMTLSGTLDSIWALLYFGYSSSYDLWDQVLEKRINRSTFFKRHFVNTRLAIGSLVECLALAGYAYAEFGLVAATVAGTLALIFKPNLEAMASQALAAEKPKLLDRFKVKVSKFKEIFVRAPSSRPSVPCFHFLITPQAFH
ncbi:hypothetical protein GW916_05695 [bacterium]|nr:hypothetical protein [bacterium]